MTVLHSLLVILLLAVVVLAEPVFGAETRCEALRNDVRQKNLRLGEYEDALKKFDKRHDSEILHVLGSKITDLSIDIQKLEKELEACDGQKLSEVPEGLSPIKSEDGQHATKSCGELRKRLIVLVKSVHSLRRRESSLLEGITDAEKKELREASEELKTVRAALESRCSAPPTPKPFRRQAQPPPRRTGN
jgi:hypothetical protein